MREIIDEKVVSMKFDNRDFERNAATSMSTLERLKSSFNFGGIRKSLGDLGNSIKGVNMGPLGDAVDVVKNRFSALEVVGVTALANITNSVVNTGKQMAESLTIDPIKEGFNEYELKMGAVQTIMNGSGESLDVVMQKLEELNQYADDTIYSFSDMTNNIGKFTNAGVNLDDAVAAIKGISNEAALSGANAEQASHAMYNFAQALSGGYVKLIDWMSIENAQMATMGFKNELLETAAAFGTVEKQADGTYKVLTTNNKGASMEEALTAKNFRDSLNYQWLTSEVLIETLKRYGNGAEGIGKQAQDAATEVKTFSQLMDTLKEAVGSGWAVTWEIIFGNFDQARELWTNVSNFMSDVIKNQAAARNELLKGWSDLGGRTAIIDGFKNALQGLLSIVRPIKEAFREIFPPTTSEQLVKLSEGFRDFTSHLTLSEEQTTNLKNVFRGLFSLIDIAAGTIGSIIKLIKPGAGVVMSLANSLLSFLGVYGDLIANNRAVIQDLISSKIQEYFSKLVEYINPVVDKLSELVSKLRPHIETLPETIEEMASKTVEKLKYFQSEVSNHFDRIKESIEESVSNIADGFSHFKDIDLSGLDDLSNKVSDKLHPISFLLDGIKHIFGLIEDLFVNGLPAISKLIGNFIGFFGDFAVSLSHYLSEIDYDKIIDIINSGAILSMLTMLTGVFKDFGSAAKNVSGFFKNAREILDGVRESLEAYQNNLKAQIIRNIAVSIGILAASLFVLSTLDSKKMGIALGVLAAMFVMLTKSMIKITEVLDPKQFMSMQGAGILLIEMAAAISILSGSVAYLSKLNWEEMIRGLIGVGAILGGLMIFLNNTNFDGLSIRSGLSIVIIAEAIKVLSESVKQLSEIDSDELIAGLLGVGALLAGLAIFINQTQFESTGVLSGVGILLIATSIKILSDAVAQLSDIDISQLLTGLFGVGTLLAGLAIFINETQLDSAGVLSGVGILMIAGSIKILADAVEQISNIDIDDLIKGLLSVAGLLTGLALFVNNTQGASIGSGVGFIMLAEGLVILADAVKKFGELSLSELAKGLVAVAGSLIIMSVAGNSMVGALPGAAAIMVMAVALNVLAPALQKLGDMSVGEILKSLITFAGAVIVFAAASLGIAPVLPLMMGLGVALGLIGGGLMLAGVGMSAMAAALPALISGSAVAVGAFVSLLKELIGALPSLVEGIVTSIVDMFVGIGNELPKILDVIKNILSSLLDLLIELAPKIIETIFVIIDELLIQLAEHSGSIVSSLIDIILGIITGISEKMADIMQALWDLVINIIDGIAAAFGNEENVIKLRDAIVNLGKSMLEALLVFFGIHSPSTVMQEVGGYLVEGLIVGIGGLIGAAVDKIRELGEALVNKIQEKYEDFKVKGSELMGKIHEGIDSAKENVKQGFHAVINSLKDFDINDFVTSGKNILEGLKRGIEDSETFNKLKETTSNVFGAVKERIRQIFDEHSPSRVTHEYGRYVVEGFANGITDYAKVATNAASQFGEGTLDKINSIVNRVTELVENGISTEPTIRPIMDLTDVNTGMRDLGSMIDANTSMELATSANIGVNTMLERNQNGVVVNNNDVLRAIVDLKDNLTDMFVGNEAGLNINNNDVVSAILDLKDNISQMNSVLQNMNIVLDTGTLVGELSEPMDRSFGRMAVMNERGV